MTEKNELKSEVAKSKPRDEEGHFVHVEQSQKPQSAQNPISHFFSEHTHYSKNQDNLLDVHIGNPLRKITNLLEDVKKQKAFAFTLKGSLGIMGVFLALSVFGILGGGKILCDKGKQSEIGVIKTLQVLDSTSPSIPVLSSIYDYFSPKQLRNRTVLIKNDKTVIRLPFSRNVNFTTYSNYPVIATGNYDVCSQTLTITDADAIEIYHQE